MKLVKAVLTVAAAALAHAAYAEVRHECFSANWDRSIAACTELIETPGLATSALSSAHAARALAFSRTGRYDSAIRDYDIAIRLVPDFAMALNNRAWAYFKSGRSEQGRADVERSLRLRPTNHHALDTRAHIRQWAGDRHGAMRDYDAAIRFGGEHMIRLYQCGLHYHRLYLGAADGIWTPALRAALETCVARDRCDPLPPDEVCRPGTS